MRTLVVFGTRPEAIKLAPVVRALRSVGAPVHVCDSGQHRELGRRTAELLGIAPDDDLGLMQADQTPAKTVERVLGGVSAVIAARRPDVVVVQGDTSTALAAALATFYAKLPLVHVEAGLRTDDLARPFPEEMNRRAISIVTELHCAATPRARDNLLAEGVPAERIELTGNPVVDSFRWACARERRPAGFDERVGSGDRPFILATVHRRESFGAPLSGILEGIRRIAAAGTCDVVVPVHPNPNLAAVIERELGALPGVWLVRPLDYDELAWALARCRLVLTDSGGLQEEAPDAGKHVVVLRDVTERPELVESGMGVLAGTSPDRIEREVRRLLDPSTPDAGGVPDASRRPGAPLPAVGLSLFGDGDAGTRIARAMQARFADQPATGAA